MERLQAGYISEECPEGPDRHGSIKPWFSYTTSNGIISNTVALGDKRVPSLLLDLNRFPVDLPGLEGRTPSLWAYKNGCVALVKLLLDKEGISVNSKDFDCRTPLHIAAATDHCAAMKLLLKKSAMDADSKENFGQTPLF
jgi:ankyrin repeat protein